MCRGAAETFEKVPSQRAGFLFCVRAHEPDMSGCLVADPMFVSICRPYSVSPSHIFFSAERVEWGC